MLDHRINLHPKHPLQLKGLETPDNLEDRGQWLHQGAWQNILNADWITEEVAGQLEQLPAPQHSGWTN